MQGHFQDCLAQQPNDFQEHPCSQKLCYENISLAIRPKYVLVDSIQVNKAVEILLPYKHTYIVAAQAASMYSAPLAFAINFLR